MPRKQLTKWIKALRSGEYVQSRGALQNVDGFCCLGVACKVFIPPSKQHLNEDGMLQGGIPNSEEQPHAPEWLQQVADDVYTKTFHNLTALNDEGISSDNLEPLTFDEIADILELVYIHKAVG